MMSRPSLRRFQILLDLLQKHKNDTYKALVWPKNEQLDEKSEPILYTFKLISWKFKALSIQQY